MTGLRRLLMGNDENIEQRNMSWNMLGSFLYALASMVLTIAVVQIVGEDEGGIFSFAYSTFGQHMFMVAYFGVRAFQITDSRQLYTFGEYLRLRFLTCGAALLTGLFYVFCHRDSYSFVKAATVFLMVAYKVIDGFADVFEAEFQRDGRLYLTGKSNTFRTLLSVTVFLGSLTVTGNLVFSSVLAVAAQAAGVLLFNFSVIGCLPEADWTRRAGKCRLLFQDNFVLFLSVLLDFYIFSSAKYAIDANMADKYQAVFAAIFMPTSVINLVAGFVIRPYITKLSRQWEQGQLQAFLMMLGRLGAVIAALTMLAAGGAWFLGIPVLSLLYPKLSYLLSGCRSSLLFIIFGGACNAYINLFYYALIIMQKQRLIFCGYAVSAVLAFFVSSSCVRAAGIAGGAFSYLLLMLVLAVYFGLTALWFYQKEKRVQYG